MNSSPPRPMQPSKVPTPSGFLGIPCIALALWAAQAHAAASIPGCGACVAPAPSAPHPLVVEGTSCYSCHSGPAGVVPSPSPAPSPTTIPAVTPATTATVATLLGAPLASQGVQHAREQTRQTMARLATLLGPDTSLPSRKFTLYVLSSETSLRETGDATASNPTLRVDRTDAVLGTDYRFNERWVGGASFGVANPRLRWSDATQVHGHSLVGSVYGSWSPTSQSYVATALSHERTNYTLLTDLGLGSTISPSTSHTSGTNLGLSISAGYDLSLGRISVSPYVRVDQVSSRVGNFGADAPINQGASTAINAGAQVQTNVPTSWGVLVPHARLELTHITRWTLQGNSADAYAAGTNAVFTTNPLEVDRRFGQAGVGLSMLLQRGFSVFTDYDTGFAQQNLKTWRFTLGLRAEL